MLKRICDVCGGDSNVDGCVVPWYTHNCVFDDENYIMNTEDILSKRSIDLCGDCARDLADFIEVLEVSASDH